MNLKVLHSDGRPKNSVFATKIDNTAMEISILQGKNKIFKVLLRQFKTTRMNLRSLLNKKQRTDTVGTSKYAILSHDCRTKIEPWLTV
ncbi:hypothetical protein GJ496_012005 [Pomphorhynchus laevis]|nr:hypothetical protein GJ496_012005 [Pomphorhynchus laevis]